MVRWSVLASFKILTHILYQPVAYQMDTSLQPMTVHQLSAQKSMADPDFHEMDLDPSITINCTNHSFTDSTSTTRKLLVEQFGASPTLENGLFRLSPVDLASCIHINIHNTLRLFSGIQTYISKSADPPNESSSTFTDSNLCRVCCWAPLHPPCKWRHACHSLSNAPRLQGTYIPYASAWSFPEHWVGDLWIYKRACCHLCCRCMLSRLSCKFEDSMQEKRLILFSVWWFSLYNWGKITMAPSAPPVHWASNIQHSFL